MAGAAVRGSFVAAGEGGGWGGNETRVAIMGPPNAGKSTLANALLGRAVSITSEQAGTTRDWVDAQAVLVAGDGALAVHVPVVLVDTAGVRNTPDELERESIRRAHHQAAAADVLVLLLDGTRAVSAEETELLERYDRAVVAVNKMDVPGAQVPAAAERRGGGGDFGPDPCGAGRVDGTRAGADGSAGGRGGGGGRPLRSANGCAGW